MNRQVSPRIAAVVIVAVIVVVAVIAWAVFFRGNGNTPEELDIGAPAVPGGGTVPQEGSPYGPSK